MSLKGHTIIYQEAFSIQMFEVFIARNYVFSFQI